MEERSREEVAAVGVFCHSKELLLIPIVHRWYNVPPDPSKLKLSADVKQESGVAQLDPENSRPLDFETFVPNHDPTLAQPSQAAFETYAIPPAPGERVSRDEAFNRALGAMYWAGYWTAIYHVSYITPTRWSDPMCSCWSQSHEHNDRKRISHDLAENGCHDKQGEDENAGSQDEEDEELLISTQR